MSQEIDEYETVKSFAERNGVSETTVRNLIYNNKIVALKFGRVWCLPKGQVYPA